MSTRVSSRMVSAVGSPRTGLVPYSFFNRVAGTKSADMNNDVTLKYQAGFLDKRLLRWSEVRKERYPVDELRCHKASPFRWNRSANVEVSPNGRGGAHSASGSESWIKKRRLAALERYFVDIVADGEQTSLVFQVRPTALWVRVRLAVAVASR